MSKNAPVALLLITHYPLLITHHQTLHKLVRNAGLEGMVVPIGVNLSSKPFSISFPASGWKCVLRGSASQADKLRRSLRIIAPTQSMGASQDKGFALS